MLVDASPRSAQDVIAYHKQKYNEGVQDGSIIPFTYPMFSLGLAVVVVFMLIPPQSPFDTPLTRWAVVTFMAYWHVWIIVNCRSFNEAPSFGIGIVSACLILWTATTLIFHDSKREFKRIESKTYVRHRGEWWGLKKPRVAQEAEAEAEESSNRRMSNGNSAVHSLKKMGGQADLKATADSQSAKTSATPSAAEEAPSNEYFWQGYPSGPLIERLDWVADLYCSFRGTGWNWLISGLPGPPHHIQAQLSSPSPNSLASVHRSTSLPISRAGVPRFDTFRASILHTTWLLTSGYIALDACLTLITHDPYFWGLTSAPVPAFLPAPLHTSWALARAYRLVLSMTLIWLCLRTFFALAPLVYVGALGPRRLGPRGEPWLYPDHYGAYVNVLRRGLAGWWGGWWHQTFRFTFAAAGEWALRVSGVPRGSALGRAVSVGVAFGLSGVLHACGSVTQMGETRPLAGPFAFFALQPVGLLLEAGWRREVVKRMGWEGRVSWGVAYVANFVWVHAWLFVTAPLLVDDFARGGIWMFQPFPVSVFRGLGFGAPGTGWWCWGGEWARWHWDSQGRLWMSGIAL